MNLSIPFFDLPLGFYPTAISGDGRDTIFVGGVSATGVATVVAAELILSDNGLQVVSVTPVAQSGRMSMLSDLAYMSEDGATRLFALDGPTGKIGYADLSSGGLTLMASMTTDAQMAGWKSMSVFFDAGTSSLLLELGENFPFESYYEKGDALYLLSDLDNDSTLDQRSLRLAEEVCFPD